ncbi:ribosomal protein L22/L17 [Xylaria flabelliformis]|nr:ribosomal protein L22/L17 [Xylaria flabelliformis]
MSLHLPSRRAATAACASIAKPSLHLRYLLPRTQRRNAWFDAWRSGGKKTPADETSSPFAKSLTKLEKDRQLVDRLSNRTQGSTIFDEDIKGAEEQQQQQQQQPTPGPGWKRLDYSRMKEHMEMALNPDPRWKIRYQRKKIMQMVRANGKLSREEQLKLTEKEVTSKSESLPTSIKKLGHLSRQIAGKTVDDAIAQMRFSKKKAAREVLYQLEEARAEAVASRGMGLGATEGQLLSKKRTILTKDGDKLEVEDPTRLYVDQSWVTKGPIRSIRVQYHARGRMSFMKSPTSRINLILKEEKTRIRLHDERVAKEAKKAPWIHLPNRPVTAQRQYYSW